VFVQKADNLQVWNDDIVAQRRYAVLRVNDHGGVEAVRVIDGARLASLDRTGTLTQKHQARYSPPDDAVEVFSASDTAPMLTLLAVRRLEETIGARPTDLPEEGEILPIAELAKRLGKLVGKAMPDPGVDQERSRAAVVHGLACRALGFSRHNDDGQFPDIRRQLLEVKLQTSPTIDLGLHDPRSEELLPFGTQGGAPIRCCDVRFAIFKGELVGARVVLKSVTLCTGADFYGRFPKFGGKGVNKKLQIPLPAGFFSS
jgi:hypothetical protein